MDDPSLLGARAREELFAEALDLLDVMERNVGDLDDADLGRAPDAEHLREVFRAVHTLKGLSGLFGVAALTDFAHAFEDLLDGLLFDRLALDHAVYALLDDATAALSRRVRSLRAGDGGDDPAFDDVLARLRECATGDDAAVDAAALPEWARGLTVHEEHRLRARLAEGDDVLALGLTSGATSAIVMAGELPSVSAVIGRLTGEAGRLLPPVRVNIQRYDQLLADVGELALLRNGLADLAARARGAGSVGPAELTRLQRSLGRTIHSLQRGLLEARMVPLGRVFERLGRDVRRLSRELSREVRLVVTGAATSIDKQQVDELGAPLLHLLRNAIDHGIESPSDRVAQGKDREGAITVNAWQSGSHVVLEVEDDGRGIDVADVRRVAVARGLVNAAAARSMGEGDLLGLLFRPGFSTRAEVTGASGRGVGLDVVRSAIARLGGVVGLRSERGRYTRVTITLPVTLALVACLVVEASGRRYAIPLSAISEVVRVTADGAQRVDGRATLSMHGRSVPLFSLGGWLGHARGEGDDPFAVLLSLAGCVVGLRVERIVARRDVVIKPLGAGLRDVRGFAGAAELGDQRATLVLDPAALLEDLLTSERSLDGAPS